MINKYEDIINLVNHKSKTHPHMSIEDRAAQFAPFAALTGYGEAINEAGRLVDKKKELTDEEKANIDMKINFLLENKSFNHSIFITYFIKDKLKDGGQILSITGIIKKYDQITQTIELKGKIKININDILSITGDCFKDYE